MELGARGAKIKGSFGRQEYRRVQRTMTEEPTRKRELPDHGIGAIRLAVGCARTYGATPGMYAGVRRRTLLVTQLTHAQTINRLGGPAQALVSVSLD